MQRGIVYAATHEKYAIEAINAYTSVLDNYQIPAILYLNKDIVLTTVTQEKILGLFREVIYLDENIKKYLIKIHAIKKSPFSYTLFLDGDTFCCRSIEPVFQLLDHFEMGAGLSGTYHNYPKDLYEPKLMNVQIEYNTGVLLFNKSKPNTIKFIDLWLETAEKLIDISYLDQLSFRDTLIMCDNIKMATIPDNWNFTGSNTGRIISGPIYIIHERFGTKWFSSRITYSLKNSKMKRIAQRFNKTHSKRLILGSLVISCTYSPYNVIKFIKKKLGGNKIFSKKNMLPESDVIK